MELKISAQTACRWFIYT